jgi:AcrR family transcriptional regulator
MRESIETSTATAPLSRRDRKRERTRGEIYAAAMNLFLSRGFEAVTIEEICRSADVARATFFLHFPAKESLLAEYGARANEELAALIRRHRGSATATLRASLKMLAERALRNPEVARLVARESLSRPRLMLEEHQEQGRDFISLIAAVLQRGQASGEFRRKIHPVVAAVAICSTFFTFVYEWIRTRGELDMEGAIAQTLDVILNGLRERKRTASS